MEKIDIDKLIQKYEPILLDRQHIEVRDMWFYNVAKKIGFNFNKPDREVINNSNNSVFVYRLGNTPICIKDSDNLEYYELCIKFKDDTDKYWSKDHIPRIICELCNKSNNIEEMEILLVELINELLVISEQDPINQEDYLPDDVDSLINIINGEEK